MGQKNNKFNCLNNHNFILNCNNKVHKIKIVAHLQRLQLINTMEQPIKILEILQIQILEIKRIIKLKFK